MLEVYVDNFIQLAQTNNDEVLQRCSQALLHGVHSVFPPPDITGYVGEEPVLTKKLLEGEGLWEVQKEILGWVFNGATRCIKLVEKKQAAILKEVTAVLQIKKGVSFKRIEKLIGKLRHAAISIPSGLALFGPINLLLAVKLECIFWKRCPELEQAIHDWQQIIQESGTEATNVNELVPAPPDYKVTLNAPGEGAGGVWIPGKKGIAPIVWRVK